MACGSNDHRIRLIDLRTGRVVWTLHGHAAPVHCLAITRDGKLLASGSGNPLHQKRELWRPGELKVWHLTNRRELLHVESFSGPVGCVAFSPSGEFVAAGSSCRVRSDWHRFIQIWEVATGRHKMDLRGHAAPVTALAYSPDGKEMASGSQDGSIVIWSLDKRKEVARFWVNSTVTSVAYSPDGRCLYSGAIRGEVTRWDRDTGQPKSHHGKLELVYRVVTSPSGDRLIAAGRGKSVRKK